MKNSEVNKKPIFGDSDFEELDETTGWTILTILVVWTSILLIKIF